MAAAEAPLAGRTILVVEDDWLVRQEIFKTLTKAHCDVLEASNGEYAVRLLEGQRTIDVLITDTRLTALLTG